MLNFTKGNTSLINWLTEAGTTTELLEDSLKYDNQKTERLEKLHRSIGLPVTITHYLNGEKFNLSSPELLSLINERGGMDQLLAFRVAPKEQFLGAFAVIKKYGLTFSQFNQFFVASGIDPSQATIRITDYRGDLLYSAIIVVSRKGIIGEFVAGDLYKLTYADTLKDKEEIIPFYQEPGGAVVALTDDPHHIQKINEIISRLRVKNGGTQELLSEGFTIAHNFVCGYYEYIEGKDGDGAFTDSNNKKIATNIDVVSTIDFLKGHGKTSQGLHGLVAHASSKNVSGTVQVIDDNSIGTFKAGCILVCGRTHVGYLPAMKKAQAIITEQGGIMSHPAIIARELGVPCIVGCRQATSVLADGDIVEVDTSKGVVKVIRRV